MRSNKLTVVLAASVALALPVLFASPAAAATLPSGDSLWAISCDSDNTASLFSVDPATGAGTKIGTGTGLVGGDCASQPAWNPVNNTAYYINWGSGNVNNLASIDLTTGLATHIGLFPSPPIVNYPAAIAIGLDGAAYAYDRARNFYKLDLATGGVTLIAPATIGQQVYSFSVDPTSGLFYAVDIDNAAYRIDVATGAATYLGTILADEDDEIYSLQIDSAGAWWVNVWTGSAPAETWYGPQPSGEVGVQFGLVGVFDDADPESDPYTEALLITYPPKLAATGADTSALLLGGGGVATLLLVGGAILMIRRRETA